MGIGWVGVVAAFAYVTLLVVAILAAGIAYGSARGNIKEAGSAFATAAFAIFWTFKGFALCHAVISGDIFVVDYWSWFAARTFDFSWNGFLNLLGTFGACLAFMIGYSVLVAMTIWSVPTLGRSREGLKISVALFVVALGLDYAWLTRFPELLF